MNKNQIYFLFFFLASSMYSQNIVLKYIGNTDESIPFVCYTSQNILEPMYLNKNQRSLEVIVENSAVIQCVHYKKPTPIFALPNETIEFKINEKGLIEYSCISNRYRELESKFVNKCIEKYGKAESISDNLELRKIRLANKITKYFDPEYIKEQELLEFYYSKDEISQAFYDYFKTMYWSLALINKLESKPVNQENFIKIEKSFQSSDSLIMVREYRLLLDRYIKESLKIRNKVQNLYTITDFIVNTFESQKIKDYLLYSYMNYALNSRDSKYVVDQLSVNLFRAHCKNQDYLNAINLDLQPKSPPLPFQELLKKHEGKLVLIDFWASWCMPCRAEFPDEEKLIKKYPNMSFVFISIDKSVSSWKKAMSQYPSILKEDNSYLLSTLQQNNLLKELQIKSIPRYILVGKNGNLLHKDAPRPSSNELEILIKKYL